MLRRAYDWCINHADKPYALWLMGVVSFLESSVFPVPPDAMLIPMSLARPERAWLYATVCTGASVAGGVLGYFIGAYLYDVAQKVDADRKARGRDLPSRRTLGARLDEEMADSFPASDPMSFSGTTAGAP